MTWGTDEEQAIRRGRWVAWSPFLLTVIVLAGILAYGAGIYADLPDPVPTHWGASGEPDAWDEKSFGSVFMGLFISAGTAALMAVLALIVPAVVQPQKDPTPYQRYRQEGTTRAIVSVLGWVSALTALFVGYVSVTGWIAPDQLHIAVPLVLFMMGILAVIVLPFRSWERWATHLAAAHGIHPSPEDLAEDRLWLPGGIYNNPDDQLILVPKREGHGTGLTVNVGHRRGKTAVAVFVTVFVVAPIALVAVLSTFG